MSERRYRLLDLFCGAGGAAMGYYRAGFTEIVGIDIKPQPRYPFRFIQGDALKPPVRLEDFDAIHASPPCQAFTSARVIHGRKHADLLTPTRLMLADYVYVIENVANAPMRADYELCASQFDGHRDERGQLIRHRLFETNIDKPFHLMPPCRHDHQRISVFGHGGDIYFGVDQWRSIMGIEWMTRDELAQAIPPSYTEFIGKQLLTYLQSEAVA